jgi:hypothetical protein
VIKEEQIPVQKGVVHLQVRTDSRSGSGDRLKIKLHSDGGFTSVQLKFSWPMMFLIGSCTDFIVLPRIQIPLPENVISVWTIIRTADVINIYMDGREVLEFQLADETCKNKKQGVFWKKRWSKETVAVSFYADDTASIAYRQPGLLFS